MHEFNPFTNHQWFSVAGFRSPRVPHIPSEKGAQPGTFKTRPLLFFSSAFLLILSLKTCSQKRCRAPCSRSHASTWTGSTVGCKCMYQCVVNSAVVCVVTRILTKPLFPPSSSSIDVPRARPGQCRTSAEAAAALSCPLHSLVAARRVPFARRARPPPSMCRW